MMMMMMMMMMIWNALAYIISNEHRLTEKGFSALAGFRF
jgi:hypothetical protein